MHYVPRRERLRAQTQREIRAAARRQMEQAGTPASLSLKALAHELGLAGPSLYRYVRSRDDLLTQILVEAYTELADVLEEVAAAHADPGSRFRAYARAYRSWALRRPAMYELLFGTAVPGYAAPESATKALARRSLTGLVVAVAELCGDAAGEPGDAAFDLAVRLWARMHGVVSLELRGHMAHLSDDLDGFYEAEIDAALAAVAGLSGRGGGRPA